MLTEVEITCAVPDEVSCALTVRPPPSVSVAPDTHALTVELIVLIAPGLTLVMGGNICPRETLSNLSAACA